MSTIESLVFKQALQVDDKQGIIWYRKDGSGLYDEYWYDFTGSSYIELSTLDPSYGETHHSPELELTTFSNGVKLVYEYYSWVDSRGLTHVSIDYKYKDGTQYINDPTCYPTSSVNVQFDYQGDEAIYEAGGVRFYPSQVSYSPPNHPAEIGEGATQVFPGGVLVYKNHLDLIHDRTILTGEMNRNDIHGWKFTTIGVTIQTEEAWQDFLEGIGNHGDGSNPYIPVNPDDDPFERDPSRPGGGGGDYYPDPDPIGIPDLPSGGAIGTGLVTLYNPSKSQLSSLAQVLWSDDFVTNVKKIMNDPMDGLVFLSLCPYSPSNTGNFNCKIGNFDSGVSMPGIGTQYYQKDCGSVNLKEKWGNALDYAPYTQAEIFLPFVGFRSLKIEDVMSKTITVKYNLDILSGAGVAFVKCGDSVLYQYSCNTNANIPLSGSTYANIVSQILNVTGGAIGGAVISGGSPIGAVGGALISATNVAMSKQSSVERGSGIGSFCGMLGDFTPYIVLHRPQQSLPQNFKQYKGYPSNITSSLSALSGYTEVEYVHLDGIPATDVEKNEIDRLLKEGILL